MEGNDNLDSFFKYKLEDGQANVPEGSWQAISQKVAEEKKKKSRGFILPIPLFWIAASFLVGTATGAVSFYTYNLETENEKLRSQLVTNESIVKPNLENSASYSSSSSFRIEGLKISDGFYQRVNSKYIFPELPGKQEKSFNDIAGYHKENNQGKNYKKAATSRHAFSITNHTTVNEGGENLYGKANLVSELNTPQVLNDQPNNLAEIVEGNKNLKSEKSDSLSVKPDSVAKVASIAKAEQENKIKKAGKVFGFPISAGIYVTPEMASRSINFSEESDPELVKYKQKDERKFGFSAGLNLDIHLPKNFFIRTGINYWNVGEKNTVLLKHTEYDTTINTTTSSINTYTLIKSTQTGPGNTVRYDSLIVPGSYTPGTNQVMKITSSDVTSTNTNITESASQFSSTISNNYHYLGIPLLVGMKMSNKKLSFGLFSGLITNVLLSPSNSVYYVYHDPEQPDKFVQAKRELSRFLLVYSGGMDFDYKLSKQWTASISPNIKYSVTSIYKDASVKQLPYSFGIQFGVKYRIGN